MKHVAVSALWMVIFFTSCNGQVKQDSSKEKQSETKGIAAEQAKPTRIQGPQNGGTIGCSLQDKAGNLWFGTQLEGLYKYDGKSFSRYTVTNGLNGNRVWCLFEDKAGNLWIGTEAGPCLYDGKTFTPISIPLRKDLPANQYRNTHDVFSIMQDKSGKLWFATIDGVYVYDGKTKTFTPFIVSEGGGGYLSSNPNVEYILEDKAGTLWFGGRGNEGVFRYDGKTVTNLTISEEKDFNWGWPALQDKQGNIWFSNWKGAYRYDGKSFIKLDGLSTGPITRIMEDQKGNLWFGGGNRGICRYDGKSFTCFTTTDGLPHNDVWSILEDRTGHLWIGTRNSGLSRYDGKTFANSATIATNRWTDF